MSTFSAEHDAPFGHNHGPYIAGEFSPVAEEQLLKKLPIEGEIPKDLNGVYLRNGPNPRFEPKGSHHFFDGDGMLHSGEFRDGEFTYRNKYVRTADLEKKESHERVVTENAKAVEKAPIFLGYNFFL